MSFCISSRISGSFSPQSATELSIVSKGKAAP
uniref:Uncharacterized protein n=1 Tax=Rhizophora mucronata TaxID=61149 RepID=A0A2P2PAA0_RHIMU